jgi:hypothetical protein
MKNGRGERIPDQLFLFAKPLKTLNPASRARRRLCNKWYNLAHTGATAFCPLAD